MERFGVVQIEPLELTWCCLLPLSTWLELSVSWLRDQFPSCVHFSPQLPAAVQQHPVVCAVGVLVQLAARLHRQRRHQRCHHDVGNPLRAPVRPLRAHRLLQQLHRPLRRPSDQLLWGTTEQAAHHRRRHLGGGCRFSHLLTASLLHRPLQLCSVR